MLITRFLSLTCVLIGAALTVAVGSDKPAAGPQKVEVKLRTENTVQEPSSSVEQDRSHDQSNEIIPQPQRIEYSYPLKGDAERRNSIKVLQQLTVDLLALHNIYKQMHWDLTGPLYLQLHEYYQQQADFYLQQADTFAERVLHLGASVDGRYSTIARTTKLAELPAGYLIDDQTIKLLLDRVTVLEKEIYEFIRETEGSDPPTSNKLQDLAYSVDKNLWQLRAHLQRPSSRRGDLPWVGRQTGVPLDH
jgi:starvation-inducible DNA-binding protein